MSAGVGFGSTTAARLTNVVGTASTGPRHSLVIALQRGDATYPTAMPDNACTHSNTSRRTAAVVCQLAHPLATYIQTPCPARPPTRSPFRAGCAVLLHPWCPLAPGSAPGWTAGHQRQRPAQGSSQCCSTPPCRCGLQVGVQTLAREWARVQARARARTGMCVWFVGQVCVQASAWVALHS